LYNWRYPDVLRLEEFPSNTSVSFLLNIETALECEIISKADFVDIFPKKLKQGNNTVSVIISPISDNICVFGEIDLVCEEETKRIIFNGKSKALPKGYYDNKVLFDANGAFENIKPAENTKLTKGQNVSVNNLVKKDINVKLDWLSNLQELDVETFTFILDEDFLIESRKDFIFFGNPESNGVSYSKNDRTVTLKLKEIKENAKKIIIAYNLYKSDNSFKKIHLPNIKIIIDNVEFYTFPLSLQDCQTVIGIEFYLTKSGWRLNAIGAEYDAPFESLCSECGILSSSP
jgi:stress response protein SCP2